MFGARLKELLSPYEPLETDDAAIISIDKMGIDVRVRFGHDYNVERVGFNTVSPRVVQKGLGGGEGVAWWLRGTLEDARNCCRECW